MLAHLFHLRLDNELAIWRTCVLLEVLLMVLLCRKEFAERNDLRHNSCPILERLINLTDHLFRRPLFFFGAVQNDRAILLPRVRSLPIGRCRIMRAKKDR